MHDYAPQILRHRRVTSAAILTTPRLNRQHARTQCALVRVLLCVRSCVQGAIHRLPYVPEGSSRSQHAPAPEESLDLR